METPELYQQKLERQRQDALKIFESALESVQPQQVVDQSLTVGTEAVSVDDHTVSLSEDSRIWVFGIGKASARMAESIESRLYNCIHDGLIIVPYGTDSELEIIQTFEAAHPLPDANSYACSLELISMLKQVHPDDVVVFLLSGGASALSCIPSGKLEVDDIRDATRILLNSGATIHEINTVRRHLSDVKGGKLAQYLPECEVLQLLISDVPGNALNDIGSGPMVPDPSTYNDALIVLKKYHLLDRMPACVVNHLKKGRNSEIPETIKTSEQLLASIYSKIVASSNITANRAAGACRDAGYNAHVFETSYSGETRKIAKWIAGRSIDVLSRNTPVEKPAALIFHGESYPNVTGDGIGGRNQELALAFGLAVEGHHNITILSAGTDGIDGPTDAAGAICDSETALKARDAGLEPESFLINNDSNSFFNAMNALVKTGPTGTNVMDLQIVLISK